ncbi:MAG: copper chaperone PCu(A)C [Streptomycetaceae bacterium]|nr:copper chaperone PCu(A)C [Streptomycetaceae bacterium]
MKTGAKTGVNSVAKTGLRGALTAAAPPLVAGLAAILLLAAWVGAGAAGRARTVRVTDGVILVGTGAAPAATGAYFRIENPGDVPDELIDVRVDFDRPDATPAHLTTHEHTGEGATETGRPKVVNQLTVPARGRLVMSPMGEDVSIPRPGRLIPGQRVDFILTFRNSGDIRVTATAVSPTDLRDALVATVFTPSETGEDDGN